MEAPGPPSPENSLPPGDEALEPAGSDAPRDAAPRTPAPPPGPERSAAERPGKAAASKPVERPLTIGQVQRILEMRLGFTLSINALERWCRHGKIYAVRLGYEWRIPREAVEELIKTALHGERL